MAQQSLDMSPNDQRLIEEALHRLERHDNGVATKRDTVRRAMVDQIHRGRRDIFTLVRTGRQALLNS